MNKYIRFSFTYFFPFLMVVYYLSMRGLNLNTFILLPLYFLFTLKALEIAIKNRGNTFVKGMNIFLFYCLLSIIFYLFNDTPISCYFDTLRSFVFPVSFAYLGYKYSTDNEFNKWYLFGCTFCFIIGFYLYLDGPSYYVKYLSSIKDSSELYDPNINESNILNYARFSSFFPTSYAIEYFSIPALILSLAYTMNDKIVIPRMVCYFTALIAFVSALLCQQRLAMGFDVIIVIFYFIFQGKLSKNGVNLSTILSYVVIAIVIFMILGHITHFEWYDRVETMVLNRFAVMDFSEAMNQRSGQYTSFNRATNFSLIFGLGLGSCGHSAIYAGLRGVADGEFVKSFYEFGVIGCSIIGFIILATIFRGIRNIKKYHAEVLIMIFYLGAGVGSNSLTFFIYSIMFWYSMGRIWNREYAKV